jgi:hypothetical protein
VNPEDTGADGQEQDNSFYPYKPRKDGGKELPNGCEIVHGSSSGNNFWSCRWEASTKAMTDHGLATKGYRIDAVVDLGPQRDKTNQELSITTGGPGSTDNNCCGFTARVNINDGTLQMESEDWTHHPPDTTGATFCHGADCTDGTLKSISKIENGKAQPLYSSRVNLSLIVQNDGTNASYTLIATGPGGTVTSKTFKNPPAHKGNTGPAIIPYHFIHQGQVTSDGDRIRCDSCQWVNFNGGPKVSLLPAGFRVNGS